jgi:hypothetical protein
MPACPVGAGAPATSARCSEGVFHDDERPSSVSLSLIERAALWSPTVSSVPDERTRRGISSPRMSWSTPTSSTTSRAHPERLTAPESFMQTVRSLQKGCRAGRPDQGLGPRPGARLLRPCRPRHTSPVPARVTQDELFWLLVSVHGRAALALHEGRTVGILGLGRIGRAVAQRLDAFSVPVVYHGRRQQTDVAYRYYADLVEMARDVDILVVVAPGGPKTRMVVDARVLDALGPDGILINVARGSLVDEAALITALGEGSILSAGLDVFETEPHVPAELIEMDHVVLLPHVGSASVHTRDRMGQLVVDNVKAWFETGRPLTPVAETPLRAAFRCRRAPGEAVMAGQSVSRMCLFTTHSGATDHDQTGIYTRRCSAGSNRYRQGAQRSAHRSFWSQTPAAADSSQIPTRA